jgi:SAM-dependent methyltransferase
MALLRPAGERLIERVVWLLNAGPTPVVEALFGPIQARVLHVAVRTGMLARLARGPATAEQLARELGLAVEPTRLVLACLATQRHVGRDGDAWRLTRRARRWLDPSSPRSVHGYLDHTGDYWGWWARLEDVVRGAPHEDIHGAPPGDPSWERYQRGQYELARLSAPEIARRLTLPPAPRALLDLAGGHGWFAAELVRRHPTLTATVLDLPGAARVGREIVAEAGMSARVHHVEGDVTTAELGGPYDAALAFNLLHHLAPAQVEALLGRVHAALRPGGTLAILDLFGTEGSGAHLGLFFHLTSGAATYSPAQVADWLQAAGFGPPRATALTRLPAQTLLQSTRP